MGFAEDVGVLDDGPLLSSMHGVVHDLEVLQDALMSQLADLSPSAREVVTTELRLAGGHLERAVVGLEGELQSEEFTDEVGLYCDALDGLVAVASRLSRYLRRSDDRRRFCESPDLFEMAGVAQTLTMAYELELARLAESERGGEG